MSLTMLRMELKIVILAVSNCSSFRQWGHLVRSHLLTQTSQARTFLQHVNIIKGGSVNPWHIIQRNTVFNGITSSNNLEMFPSGMIILFWSSVLISWISSLPTLFVIVTFHNLQWQKSSLHSMARKVYL